MPRRYKKQKKRTKKRHCVDDADVNQKDEEEIIPFWRKT